MTSKWRWIALGVGTLVILTGIFSQMRRVEEPKFILVEQVGAFELRDYPSLLVAEATVKGERKIAIQEGFRLIADYIFGNNISAENVAMTAPVTQQPSEAVAMTAPVTQQADGNAWAVRFIMPARYTLDTIPKPKNAAVTVKQIDGQRMAVLRFSGAADDQMFAEKAQVLTEEIKKRSRSALAAPTYAFYDPPWTLGAFRRNEVMIPIGQ